MPHLHPRLFRVARATLGIALGLVSTFAAEGNSPKLEELAEQNRRLQEQVREQQKTIEAITTRLMHVLRVSERHERELLSLHQRLDAKPASTARPPGVSEAPRRDNSDRVSNAMLLVSSTTGEGQSPECEFRLDHIEIVPTAAEWRNACLGPELKLRLQVLAWNPGR